MASDLSLICSWSLSSTVEVQALNKAGVLSFRLIEDQKISEISLKKIRGYIPLENFSLQRWRSISQLLVPVRFSDNEWIFSLMYKEFDVQYPVETLPLSPCCHQHNFQLINLGFFDCIFSIKEFAENDHEVETEIHQLDRNAPRDEILTFSEINKLGSGWHRK